MSKPPRESLVQYQQPIESLLSDSHAEKARKHTGYDSRLAIDGAIFIIQNC